MVKKALVVQMKRKKKRKKEKLKRIKRKNFLYPIMWCTGEDLAIAVSRVRLRICGYGKVARVKDQVSLEQWHPNRCSFRTEEYVVDLRNATKGERIKCPKCGAVIDFRAFPSSRPPKLTEITDVDTKTTAKKLPKTQDPES